MKKQFHLFQHLRDDIPASIVVFLVAMPLCLGIAMASGAPLYSGLISGVIGGLVVGALSGSPLGVSGPAAGLALIVLTAIEDLGSFEIFLLAVVISGAIQLLMGFLRAGVIADFFPSPVIHGMLAGIGLLIFIKQIPHFFGYDKDPEGDWEFFQPDGENTFSEIFHMVNYISPGVIIISVTALVLLILWETKAIKSMRFSKIIQGPLVAVVVGVVLGLILQPTWLAISSEHMVNIPLAGNFHEFAANFTFPDFNALANKEVYITALLIAVVGSLETLLCVEAADKLDPYKRITPTNRELKAQGIGNILAGLIGGLPVTQVIVRSSANAQSGARTKLSAILHGVLLLVSIVLVPNLLNLIPLGVLASILLVVGYKLARPALFKRMYRQGWEQFIPFVATIIGILATDLLFGILIGLAFSVFVILRNNFKVAYTLRDTNDDSVLYVELAHDITFLNKASIRQLLSEIKDHTAVTLDGRKTRFLHHDVHEIIRDFIASAKARELEVTLIGFDKNQFN